MITLCCVAPAGLPGLWLPDAPAVRFARYAVLALHALTDDGEGLADEGLAQGAEVEVLEGSLHV